MNVREPTLPSGVATFCDDIRYEKDGKFSQIGIYSGEMSIFGTAPATIPMLWASVRWRIPPTTEVKEVVVRLSKDTNDDHMGELLAEAQFPINPPFESAPPQGTPSQFSAFRMIEVFANLRVSPLFVDAPCKLRVRVVYDGDEHRVGAMLVRFAPPDQARATEA